MTCIQPMDFKWDVFELDLIGHMFLSTEHPMPVIPRTRSNSLKQKLEWSSSTALTYEDCGQMFVTSQGGVACFTLKCPHPVLGGIRRQAQQPISFEEVRHQPIGSLEFRDLRRWYRSTVYCTAQLFWRKSGDSSF